jgi:hypothetical protein
VTAPTSVPSLHLGFLTVRHEAGGYLGGYLVTNAWGRPLEFRMSTAIQPNRVQQILYADTLDEYLSSDVIGKTLIEKTSTPAELIITDTFEALNLRRTIEQPVVWVAPPNDPRAEDWAAHGSAVRPAEGSRGPLIAHPEFADGARIIEILERLGALDLSEPFMRIRDAVAEARKMGVMQRAG